MVQSGILVHLKAFRLAGKLDSYAVLEDQKLVVSVEEGVLANDIGDAVTAQIVSGASSGTVVFSADGSFSYTPK